MKKMNLVMISSIALISVGVLGMQNLFGESILNNNLCVKYYLGMSFPKYNHPAKLHDEIDVQEVEKIKKSSEMKAYYVGFYKNNNLIKFEKYLNNKKIIEFIYTYNSKGQLIKIDKKNFE